MNTRSTLFPRSSRGGVEAGLPGATAVQNLGLLSKEELSPLEASALHRCEQTIRKGLTTFVEVGIALAEIRDKRLYRGTHDTWEAYCLATWGFTARFATYKIEAAAVVKQLQAGEVLIPERPGGPKPKPPLPDRESVARPLTRLPAADQAPAWREAVASAPNGQPTARHVEAAVRTREIPLPSRAGDTEPAKPNRVQKILDAVNLALERLEILRKLIDVTDTPCQGGLRMAVLEVRAIQTKFLKKRNDLLAKAGGWIEVRHKRNLRGTYGPARGGGNKAPERPGRRVATTPLRTASLRKGKPHLTAAARARLSALARARWAKVKAGGSQTNNKLARALSDARVKAAARGKGL
jgi:hypothetical protein